MARLREKHGYYHHPLYKVWAELRQRCTNPNNKHYHHYGGRGITVCDEWLQSGAKFVEWALNNGWAKGLELDRANNDLGYSPENCRFVTHGENNRNQRKYHKRPETFKKKSGLPIGVRMNGKWYQAGISINKKSVYLGTFSTSKEASDAYQQAKAKLVEAK